MQAAPLSPQYLPVLRCSVHLHFEHQYSVYPYSDRMLQQVHSAQLYQRVLNAYARMGFTVTVDPNAAYAGHFDARSRSITIQEADETIYHELGHFLAFIAGNVDQSSAFASVYNSEKAKFTGYNKAYATQNAAEYFAESVKDYMLNGAALSSQRPETYKAIQSALNTVTTARADAILKAYSPIWN